MCVCVLSVLCIVLSNMCAPQGGEDSSVCSTVESPPGADEEEEEEEQDANNPEDCYSASTNTPTHTHTRTHAHTQCPLLNSR